ncbi:UNVERIFIED_CONTAM: hypothetical protein GTU68_024365 [Idotea baltica]|nr:hypothetical protein [Idotea baltica]
MKANLALRITLLSGCTMHWHENFAARARKNA